MFGSLSRRVGVPFVGPTEKDLHSELAAGTASVTHRVFADAAATGPCNEPPKPRSQQWFRPLGDTSASNDNGASVGRPHPRSVNERGLPFPMCDDPAHVARDQLGLRLCRRADRTGSRQAAVAISDGTIGAGISRSRPLMNGLTNTCSTVPIMMTMSSVSDQFST